MASVLKRKGGPLGVVEPSKRSRSTKNSRGSAPELDLWKVGWRAAFGPDNWHNGTTSEVNGNGLSDSRATKSPEAEDYQDLLEQARSVQAETKKRKKKPVSDSLTWKISDPIGGRMIDVDPIFTEDEK